MGGGVCISNRRIRDVVSERGQICGIEKEGGWDAGAGYVEAEMREGRVHSRSGIGRDVTLRTALETSLPKTVSLVSSLELIQSCFSIRLSRRSSYRDHTVTKPAPFYSIPSSLFSAPPIYLPILLLLIQNASTNPPTNIKPMQPTITPTTAFRTGSEEASRLCCGGLGACCWVVVLEMSSMIFPARRRGAMEGSVVGVGMREGSMLGLGVRRVGVGTRR